MTFNSTNLIKESSQGFQTLRLEDEFFRKRHIFFTDSVTPESCCVLIQQLLKLEADSNDEITLYINSPGGSVTDCLAVCDIIDSMRSPVRTVCIGLCASAGSLMFMAGDKDRRLMFKSGRLMIHDPFWSNADMSGQKPLAIREKLNGLMKTREILAARIAESTGHTVEEILELTANDHYMTAEEAIEFGAATAVCTAEDLLIPNDED